MKRPSLVLPALAALAALAVLAGCDNAGSDRVSGIRATGVVRGSVYFDADGSRDLGAADVPFAGAGVSIISPISRDTLFRVTTAANGTFRLAGIPVGSYEVVLDPASGGDSAIVVPTAAAITVAPDDSTDWVGTLSFPIRTIAQVRASAPSPARIFVSAIALNQRTTFSDTTLHLVDATGSIRVTRVRPSLVPFATGDSVRLRARVGTRAGQVVLDDAAVFVISPTFVPTATALTTLQASTADGATRDAQLVRLTDAQITDTATVAGDLTLTVNDGTGPVRVILDRAADVGFRAPLPPGQYQVPNRFDLTGVLVPTGLGTWVLKPRSALDLLRR